MSATIFRFRSEHLVLLVLTVLLAGCGGGHSVFCAVPASGSSCTCGPCPVDPGPEFVYATSSTAGQILTFTVDHKTGALGTPTTTIGPTLPAGIASAQHQFLYVSDSPHNGVDAFSINQTTGALITVPGSPFSTGGITPFPPMWLVAGPGLYATSLGGVITGFTIASNGALTPVAGPVFVGGAGQAALGQSNTTPINYFLYATSFLDPNGAISAFKVDPVSGILTPIPGNFTTGTATGPDGIVFDGTLDPFVFVALNTANKIAAFSVDPTTGALTPVPGSPFGAGTSPVFLALSASQDFLYSMNFAGRSISAFSIASNGVLTQVPGSPFQLSDVPGGITVTGDNFLYVTLPESNQIVGFSITANGGLSALAGSPFTASRAVLVTTVQIPPP